MSLIAGVKQRASRHPIGAFLAVLVFYSGLVAAGLYAVFGSNFPGTAAIPYAWGPMVSAGVTIWMREESVRDWLGQLRNLRVGLHWYLVGIGIMILGTEFENIVAVLFGGDATIPGYPPMAYVTSFAITLFLAGALEELGWRGFLQPRLQQRFSALHASMGIGVVWGLWHVPLILGGAGNFTVFWEYMLNIILLSVVLGWLYNSTKGALPAVMISHAAHNMPPVMDVAGSVPAVFDILSGDVLYYLLCAAAITLYVGSKTLTQDGTLPGVPGQLSERLPQRGPQAE